MAEKVKGKGNDKGTENTRPAKVVGPQLLTKERPDGTISMAIKNGGRAARIFLLNEKDEMVKCLNGEGFKTAYNNEKVARSKRSMGDGKTEYMTSRVRFTATATEPEARAAELAKISGEVVANYKEVAKMVQSGELKIAKTKTKVTIVSLL
jgi:hypothetical protein